MAERKRPGSRWCLYFSLSFTWNGKKSKLKFNMILLVFFCFHLVVSCVFFIAFSHCLSLSLLPRLLAFPSRSNSIIAQLKKQISTFPFYIILFRAKQPADNLNENSKKTKNCTTQWGCKQNKRSFFVILRLVSNFSSVNLNFIRFSHQ